MLSRMQYWLMKSEPSSYSIDDLKRDGVTPWDGVRNYQARNYMRDDMRVGDVVFFYASNTDPVGIVGLGRVESEPYPDATQFDTKSIYFDPKATKENPRWCLVDITFVEKFPRCITLAELKEEPALKNMPVVQKGNRLSISPVGEKEARRVLGMV